MSHRDGAAYEVVATVDGQERSFPCDDVISSMPFRSLIRAMDPPVPDDVRAAAEGLTYRDFMTVALVVPQEFSFPDNWIYIHDPAVKVGRIQNFGSWSPYLVKEGRTCLGLEFFVNEGDDMWTKSDEDLIAQAKREVEHLGLADSSKVEAGYVVRMPKAYPVYDEHYQANVAVLRAWIAASCPERHAHGSQRHAQVQQPGSFDADRDALGREHPRCPPRRLDRERRRRVPRRIDRA